MRNPSIQQIEIDDSPERQAYEEAFWAFREAEQEGADWRVLAKLDAKTRKAYDAMVRKVRQVYGDS